MSNPEHAAFKNFPAGFRGDLLRPDDPGYAESRAIFNMCTAGATPALIARPADEQDVLTVARFVSETGTPLAVRGRPVIPEARQDSPGVVVGGGKMGAPGGTATC